MYLWFIGTEEGEEKMGKAISGETLAENFPKRMKYVKPQIQDMPQNPSRIKTKKTTPRHILKISRAKKDTLLSKAQLHRQQTWQQK